MEKYNINNFYIEINKRFNKNPGFVLTGYNLFDVTIYYKLLGIKIKIYKIHQIRYSYKDYDNFNKSMLDTIIASYIRDSICYKNHINDDFSEIRIIYSKLYYYISRIKDVLYRIKNSFRNKDNKFDVGYE